jgi:hypothetical protein
MVLDGNAWRKVVPEYSDQSLQHFVSDFEWNAPGVLELVAGEAERYLGGSDKTSFQKKGESARSE